MFALCGAFFAHTHTQSFCDASGPLPEFQFQGVVLHPDELNYTPTDQLIHPSLVKTEGLIENPLGKYYLYYAPHKHVAISLAYSDSLDSPWIEYSKNPVLEGPSAPDIRWIEDKGKFYLWGHRKNGRTEQWSSIDSINFDYQKVSIESDLIGTRNATYTRVYEYPLERFGSRYIMLYSGFLLDREIRCVWLAHSKDAENWIQIRTPLVEPIEGEKKDLYGPAFIRWKGRNFVTYQDHTTVRGGNAKYVEIDSQFNPVGKGGQRFTMIDPPSTPPLKDRYRGGEFYIENNTLYFFSSGSWNPRILVYAKALSSPAPSSNTGRLDGFGQ